MMHESPNISGCEVNPQPHMGLHGCRTEEHEITQEMHQNNSPPEMSVRPNSRTSRSSPGLEEDGMMPYCSPVNKDKKIPKPLSLFKEDFNHFKEDFVKMFRDKHENADAPLALLKEDFGHFKEDLANVFKIHLSKTKDDKASLLKENLQNTFKFKVLTNKKADGLTSSESGRDVSSPRPREEQMHKAEGQTKRATCPAEKSSKGKDSLLGDSEGSSECESGQEDLPSLSVDQGRVEDLPLLTTLPLLLSLHGNNDSANGEVDGDCWWVKTYACYLTLDPNTASVELSLSPDKRRACRVWLEHQYPAHPERFHCPQVLCREGLLDHCYWEVEWSGGADVGVAYSSIARAGDVSSCLLGHSSPSWSLECSDGFYTPCHRNRRARVSCPRPFGRRVGVLLDWQAGTLSFYCVSSDKITLLHCFKDTFTQQLYPAFWLWGSHASVALCHVEQGMGALVALNDVSPQGGDICP